MIFWRVKPLDQILATAEKKSLKRQLGPIQLTLLGIGAVIGTGIFVLTAEAAQKAGPGMMISFVIAAAVCGLAALAYAELAAMVPVSGSAYTYSYGVMGELIAWIVGWALVLEYAIGATAVCVGWAGYVNGLLNSGIFGLVEPGALSLPHWLQVGPTLGGGFNLLAFLIGVAVTGLLVIGTSKSARVNAVLVAIKIIALTAFIVIAVPAVKNANLHPFLPTGGGSAVPTSGTAVLGRAAFGTARLLRLADAVGVGHGSHSGHACHSRTRGRCRHDPRRRPHPRDPQDAARPPRRVRRRPDPRPRPREVRRGRRGRMPELPRARRAEPARSGLTLHVSRARM